jgi:hypothetical protein
MNTLLLCVARAKSFAGLGEPASQDLVVAGGEIPAGTAVNALPHVGVRSYDGRAAASYILGIRKEVLAMFTNRQTPPGIAL